MKTALRTVALNYRSSHHRCSVEKGVLRNFAKFTGKRLYQSLAWRLKAATLLKKRLWCRCFPVNFARFFRTPFLQKNSGRLLLKLEVNALGRYYQEALKKHEIYHVYLLKIFHIFFIFFMFFKHNGNWLFLDNLNIRGIK